MRRGRRHPYGVLGVFREPEPLTRAAEELARRGYSQLDALTPYPVPELDPILHTSAGRLPGITLASGLLGALAAYALILYSTEIDYPINVGGRALNAWPAYLVIAFEAGILGAALAAFFGMLVLNRLPTYYHPVFNAESFSLAKGDRFCLLVRRDDPKFRAAAIRRIFRSNGAIAIERVEP